MPDDSALPSLIRLNKAIADSGYCARRKADALILAGRVQVNDVPVTTLGVKVDLGKDSITIDGHPLPKVDPYYLLFHKPVGCVTSRQGQGKQKTIYALIPKVYQSVDPAGRLDRDSSGLLVLSNDGDFLHQVTHPRFHWPKVYEVTLNISLDEAALEKLHTGILLQPEGKLAKMAEIIPHPQHRTQYQVTLFTGYNRQIRRSMEAVGARIRTLHRVAFGPLQLGSLPVGGVRPLTQAEKQALLNPDAAMGVSGRVAGA